MMNKKDSSELFETIGRKIMKRDEVYRLINGEREYQDRFFKNPLSPGSTHEHSPEEWLMYMEHYLGEAKHILSRGKGDKSTIRLQAMSNIRKIAALAVAAMEEHDTSERIYVEPGADVI